MKLRYFFLFSLLSLVSFAQKDTKPLIVDSVTHYLNYSNRNYLDIESRFKSAKRAKELSEAYGLDSLGLKSYLSLSTIYFDNVKSADQKIHYDRKSFLKNAHAALKLATRFNDSIALAQANKDLGYYYFNVLVDSAYYYNNKAEKLYSSLNNNFYTAVVLLDVAMLQRTEEDFAGSEITTITAISLLDELDHQTDSVLRYKSYLYSNLGVVFKELEQYDEAIKYNFKAIELKKRLRGNNEVLIDNQINNLANVYKNTKDYDLAIKYYKEILDKNNIKKARPDFYAMVLDNYANTLFLSEDYSQLPDLFLEALHICDSLGDSYKSIVINQHLAEYYNFKNNKDSAKYYAYKAEKISYPNYTNELLDTYLLLTEIETDSIALKYYDKHVKLSDSLLKKERSTRNKFARIQYETDQIEKENEQIAKERMWLLIVSIVLIIASILVYVIINQRNKNKELTFIQQQQEANEEIYNLMLSQNESIEEARTLEKKRISQELHDGVLGRLFGARLSLDSLNMSTAPEAITTRGEYISQLKTIEEDIRKVSHELNTDFVSGAGFVDIISTLVETQTNIYKLKYKLDNDGVINWDDVPNRTKIHIYRIVQESLHNIHKHAKATTVKISFKLKKNVICLSIKDNGSGFDVNKAKSGIGLKNMNSRIKEIKGRLEISSTLNKGTTVNINIPTN